MKDGGRGKLLEGGTEIDLGKEFEVHYSDTSRDEYVRGIPRRKNENIMRMNPSGKTARNNKMEEN